MAPAPGRLELVRSFINTLDRERDGEPRTVAPAEDRAAVAAWLRGSGLLRGAASDAALDRAIRAREALRDLAYANHDGVSVPGAALDVLNDAARRAGVVVQLTPGAAVLRASRGSGVDAAVGELVAVVAEAMTEGTWWRLKACAKESCRWAFYDTARNRSGRWCSMAVCGNRVKAQRFRTRRAAGA